MRNHELIRKDILTLVEEYFLSKFKKRKFIQGETKVRYAGRVFDQNEMINLVDSSLDFWLTAGRFADEFEDEFAEYLNVNEAILVNSGSSANLLAISTLTSPKLLDRQLKPGDEVITVAAGFPTTVAPIIQNNLVPVFVDVDLGTYNVIPEQIEQAISSKTKALIFAHTLANPFDIDAILDIVKKNNLWFIEDNCDALGSRYKGKLTGTYGHLATFSFYPAHHITLGEGGCVISNDELLIRIARSFRDWGRDCYCGPGENDTCGTRYTQQFGKLPIGYDHKYVYSHIGYNLKVTDMQAAIGVAQLKKLPQFIEIRKENFKSLYNGLNKFEDQLILPKKTPGSDPAWFSFVISVRENAGFSRNDITKFLEENNIETRNLFCGNIAKQPAFIETDMRIVGELKNTDFIVDNTFFIGVFPGNGKEQIDYIINRFEEFLL